MDEAEISNSDTSTRTPMRARLFGAFALMTADGEEIPISNRRARALLGMLCLAPNETINRDHLSKLLWPGRFQAQARASLRQCLSDLGKTLDEHGGNVLDMDRSRLKLNKSAVQTDLSELKTLLAVGAYDDACERLTAIGSIPLLEQMNFGEAFADWLDTHRRSAEARLKAAVTHGLNVLAEHADTGAHDRLLAAWKIREPNAGSTPSEHADAVRIAVLPFRTLHDSDDQNYFADGVVDELITLLSKTPGILVAGRTSSFQFEQAEATASDIAKRLGVSHLLEGAVSRQGDELRININLTDGQTGFELWADGYNGNANNIFAFREKVARSVVQGLNKELLLPAHEPHIGTMTGNREAYNLYLQGRSLTLRAVGEGVIAKGIEFLKNALERDPEFSECWSALAEAYLYTAVFTPSLERVALAEQMADAARKAISLNPESAHARAMLGVHEFINHNPVAALDLAFEAHRLEPANVDVTVRLGSFLMYIGRTREAMPYIEAAIERDPVHGRTYIALCAGHLCLGEYDKAISAGQRMLDLGIPGFWLAVTQAAMGKHEEAVETYWNERVHLGTTIMRPPGMPPMDDAARDAYFKLAANGVCSGEKEKRDLYCQVLDGLHATMADPYDPSITFPAIWMGHCSLAMKIYREQMTLANMFGLMTLWSDSEPIRQVRLHPDFMSFAKDIGMVDAWEKYGWPDLLPRPENGV